MISSILLYVCFYGICLIKQRVMINIFTYGTLMFPEVMYTLISNQQLLSCRAVLRDFTRRQVKGQTYPGIIPSKGNSVQGILYFGVSPEDAKLLEIYENDQQNPEYSLKEVHLQTEQGHEIAGAYIYLFPERLQEQDWNRQHFMKTDYLDFLKRYQQKNK